MNYTLHQFEIFKKVVECGSISKASEELFMTQPAISIQLKKFQEQFEYPLFELKGRKIVVTDFGREVFDSVSEILEKTQQLQYKSRQVKHPVVGKLKIASASTGMYVIPYFVSEFMKEHPDIDLTLDFTNRSNAIQSLRNKEVELAVVSILPDSFAVNEEILIENELYMVCKSESQPKQLPYIFRERGSATRKMMERYFLTHKIPLDTKRKIELTSNEAVKQAVIAGMGISILPFMSIKKELENGVLKIVRQKGLPIVTHWRMISLKNRQLSPVADAFVYFVKKNKLKIMKMYFE
ncbi:MAG: LysR family transcriptional regulator [Bacteroidia bacterium]|nr:LysR family transcriptional regulator [Bacteroidia bacterium]